MYEDNGSPGRTDRHERAWQPGYMIVVHTDADITGLGEAVEAVGHDVDILIEGHSRLSPNMAIRMARLLEAYNPFFFEEPVPPENVAEMAKVATTINIPLATGQRLYTRWAYRDLLEKQATDYIQPDLCHCGGFSEGRKIAAMAETYHVRVLPHNPNGPISTLVGVHLGICTPNLEMLEFPR